MLRGRSAVPDRRRGRLRARNVARVVLELVERVILPLHSRNIPAAAARTAAFFFKRRAYDSAVIGSAPPIIKWLLKADRLSSG